MEKVIIYSQGVIALSACCDKRLSKDEIEQEVNVMSPTGIQSQWKIADEDFRDGKPNGCDCDQYPDTRKHHLLHC